MANKNCKWCPVVDMSHMKVKSNAVRTIFYRNLECETHESREVGIGQTGDDRSEVQDIRYQWTKIDGNGWI